MGVMYLAEQIVDQTPLYPYCNNIVGLAVGAFTKY